MRFQQDALTHRCAAHGCQQQVPSKLLMCVDHWRMVPAPLRREVWAHWHRLARDASARGAYDAAVRAAQDAVHAKQLKRKADRETRTRPLF